MSLWVILWAVISLALLGFVSWTLFILYNQKRVWREYAKKNNLRYNGGAFFDSPKMSGVRGDYTVDLFTGEHTAGDARMARKMTAIEIKLSSTMPFDSGIGSGGFVEVLREIGFREEFRPDHPKWEDSYIALSDSKKALKAYLTAERLDVLVSLLRVKNCWSVLIAKENVLLLRVDTPYPLDAAKKLDTLLGKMLDAAKVLELAKGEGTRLEIEKDKDDSTGGGSGALDVDEEALAVSGLELEEDEE